MAAVDDYGSFGAGPAGPYRHAAAVTPHDTNELANVTAAIYVGGTGGLKVTTAGGDAVTFAAVPAGTVLRVAAKVVWSTGTAATNIVALW
jgi:hypothetical protein